MRRLVVFCMAVTVSAHVPTFNEAGATPDSAFKVDDPTKSWVFYETLRGGQHWFTFDMQAGQELFTSVTLPADEDGRPTVWVIGPGFAGPAPAGSPAGTSGVRLVATDELSVEPFSPLAMRSVAEYRADVAEAGTYYVLVEADGRLTYGLAIGARESFTPVEWATVPAERVLIQQWGGVPWPVALSGEALGAIAAAWWAHRSGAGLRRAVGLVGAGLIAGTAATTALLATIAATKAGPSAALVIPAVFALLALGIGTLAWRTVQASAPRWRGLAIAAGGVIAWAGVLAGPALMLAWTFWRSKSPPAADAAPEPTV